MLSPVLAPLYFVHVSDLVASGHQVTYMHKIYYSLLARTYTILRPRLHSRLDHMLDYRLRASLYAL